MKKRFLNAFLLKKNITISNNRKLLVYSPTSTVCKVTRMYFSVSYEICHQSWSSVTDKPSISTEEGEAKFDLFRIPTIRTAHIQPFNKYLLSTYFLPGALLDSSWYSGGRRDFYFREAYCLVREPLKNHPLKGSLCVVIWAGRETHTCWGGSSGGGRG